MSRIIALALALAVFAAACGGGDGGDGGTPTPGLSPVPNFTEQPAGLLTPQPPPEINPEMALTEYVETQLTPAFAISHPPDWSVTSSDSQVRITMPTPDRGRVVDFAISCIASPGPLASRDRVIQVLDGVKANWTPGRTESLQLAGMDAVYFPYAVNLGAISSNVRVYFLQGSACIWQLQGVVVALPPFDDYDRLFRRMAESFREVAADSSE